MVEKQLSDISWELFIFFFNLKMEREHLAKSQA